MLRSLTISFALAFAASAQADDLVIPPPPPTIIDAMAPAKVLPKIWTGSVELGLAGADGNSENFKLRAGANLKFDSDPHFMKVDLLYSNSSANSILTENRFLGQSRYERKLGDSPWSWFVSGAVETDEFKAFDYRLSGHTGLAYTFVKNDEMLLKTRFGAGGSREFGGTNNSFTPELLFGVDYERKLNDRVKFVANVDYFPNINRFSDYRLEARATLDFLVDPTWNLTLRLGVLDRYDSTPEGRKPNDIEYNVTLLWKF